MSRSICPASHTGLTVTAKVEKVSPMTVGKILHCIDAHAEGEPTRVVVGGVIDPPGETMLEKMRHFEAHDELRRLLLFEPRGSAPLSATVVLPPCHPDADAGIIIMESCSYEGMSGTNAINTATVLLETGMVPSREPLTRLTLDAPAGIVAVEADVEGGRCKQVTFENVPCFVHALDLAVEVEGLGEVRLDIAYGGAFCAFIDAEAVGCRLVPSEARRLVELGERIRAATNDQVKITHPTEEALSYLSFVVFTSAGRSGGDMRGATVVAPGRLDRSATGTATSARVAVLAARGEIAVGDEIVNESILGTSFRAQLRRTTTVGSTDAIVPAISGRSWITGHYQAVLRQDDPFPEGYQLSDTWGTMELSKLINPGR